MRVLCVACLAGEIIRRAGTLFACYEVSRTKDTKESQ
jgi:hypothetical protein